MAEPTASDPRRCLILTGANGYIGARLKTLALARGWSVTVLSRHPYTARDGARGLPWTLGEALPPEAIDAAVPASHHALVHLAHDWTDARPGPDEGALNLDGARALFASSRALGVGRIVFVSSQSARPDAANVYGRLKWRIEQLLEGEGEVAARVGLVYGGPPSAMYGLLCELTGTLPVLPMVDPWREVQPIHLDEVCDGLFRLAEGTGGSWSGLAAPEGMPFGAFLRTLARELHGRRIRILPIPLRLALLACDLLNRLPVGPKPDRERVLGLAGTRPMDCGAHLHALGVTVAPLASRLRLEPASRKAVLAEGRALFAYVLRGSPGPALLTRYARIVGRDGPMPMAGILRRIPRLLRIAEAFGQGSMLSRRLSFALALAEASPEGERALTRYGRTFRMLHLACDLVLDAMLLPIRIVSGTLRGRRQ